MKTYYIILLSFLLAPALVLAASTDVSMGSSSIISVGGYSLVVSGTANFDTITVSSDSFTIDLSAGSYFLVTSADRRSFTTSPTTFTSFSCNSSESTLTLSNNTEAKTTVTVTPSASACSISGGSSGGGGGGGGGGGYSAPTIPAQTTTTVAAIQATTQTTTQTTTTATAAVPTTVSVSPVFATSMYSGVSSSDVKRLQQILNSDSETKIAESGAGSPGNETNFFGSATRKAVQKFQVKYDIAKEGDAGYGIVGPKTRAKIQEVFKE